MSEKKEKVIKYNKYQQGDVVMFQVDDETFHKYAKQNGGNDSIIDYNTQSHNNPILAFGEVTGHLHQIHMKDMLDAAEVTLHMDWHREAGKDVPAAFEVREKTVTLTHEEHNQLDVPPGKYVVRIVREFDHMTGRSRYVAD